MACVASSVVVVTAGTARSRAAKRAPVSGSKFYGADRPKFLGPFTKAPSYLSGEYPSDYGWDTAGISADPETFERMRTTEVIHARWALLGAVGCLVPELLTSSGALDAASGGVWFKVQSQILTPEGINYLGTHNSLPAETTWVMLAVLGQAEAFRAAGSFPGLVEGADQLYPGGRFDPLDLGSDPETLADLKVKELKNGRLAMVGVTGFFVQGITTGESPIANLNAHLASPGTDNVFKYAAGWA